MAVKLANAQIGAEQAGQADQQHRDGVGGEENDSPSGLNHSQVTPNWSFWPLPQSNLAASARKTPALG